MHWTWVILICHLTSFCEGSVLKQNDDQLYTLQLKNDISGNMENMNHVRRKRYLGLGRRFKLNRRYQECVAPGSAKGHCKHLSFCPIDVITGTRNTLEYLCVIEKSFVGICCPDDVALSGTIGSQLIMDLPGGGDDYDKNDNVTGCGLPVQGGATIASKKTTIQEWPWLAALYYPGSSFQQFCGGAVITDTHVLTAAHCLQGVSAQSFKVRLGEYDFSKVNETRSEDYDVAEIITHEDFDISTYENDIAIVRLNRPTSFNSYIWPICLPPTGETFENETVVVAGWGLQDFGGTTSTVLLQVAVPVWQQQECVDSFLQRITENALCAAGRDGGKDSCKGDSGGPLMYQLENGRWVTIGVVSWGIGCGDKGKPGVYTRLNRYIPWIIKNTIAKP